MKKFIRKDCGFTLIELMITVAIVGILAAIAYPSYQHATIKNRRAITQSFMADVAQRQQQYLLDNRSYAIGADESSTVTALQALNITIPKEVEAYYTITMPSAQDTGKIPSFVLTATPKSGTSQASDGTLTINHLGTKKPDGKW